MKDKDFVDGKISQRERASLLLCKLHSKIFNMLNLIESVSIESVLSKDAIWRIHGWYFPTSSKENDYILELGNRLALFSAQS